MLGKIEHTDNVKVKSITFPSKPIMPHPVYDVSQLLGTSAEDAASVTMEPISDGIQNFEDGRLILDLTMRYQN